MCVFSEFSVDGGKAFGKLFGQILAPIRKLPKPVLPKPSIISRSASSIKMKPFSGSLESLAAPGPSILRKTSFTSSLDTIVPEVSKQSKMVRGLKVVGQEAAKSASLGGTLILSDFISGKIRQSSDIETAKIINEQLTAGQTRAKIDCAQNQYGCLQNMCVSQCGPRLDKADWCYVGKNATAVSGGDKKKKRMEIAECEIATDCDPCWPCARTCNLTN